MNDNAESPSAPYDEEIAALRAIVEGTARSTGDVFFESLVRHLASALGVSYAFVAEFAGVATRVRTLAYWGKGRAPREHRVRPGRNSLRGRGAWGSLPPSPRRPGKFPRDRAWSSWGSRVTSASRCWTATGNVLGHLAVFDERPMPHRAAPLFIFRIFATRAAVELERLRVEQRLVESERRYRDLYEEAPNAYVSVGVRPSPEQRQPPRHAVAWLFRRGAGWFQPFWDYFAETPSGRATSRRSTSTRASPARRSPDWSWRCAGKTAARSGSASGCDRLRGADGSIQAMHSIWVDITDRVLAEAERARLQQQNLYLQEELKSVHNFEEIVGRSPALLAVLDKVRRVAPTDATVLIRGETGTGKELIARAIHSHSQRVGQAADQGQLRRPSRGTGRERAVRPRERGLHRRHRRRDRPLRAGRRRHALPGRDRRAAPETQAKLLRVLQEREFERVGGSTAIKLDVRIIAATNRDLLKAVQAKTFREDLYYRLSVFPIHLPPLRERARTSRCWCDSWSTSTRHADRQASSTR